MNALKGVENIDALYETETSAAVASANDTAEALKVLEEAREREEAKKKEMRRRSEQGGMKVPRFFFVFVCLFVGIGFSGFCGWLADRSYNLTVSPMFLNTTLQAAEGFICPNCKTGLASLEELLKHHC